jgi:hypothetical protein
MSTKLKQELGQGHALLDRSNPDNIYDLLKDLATQVNDLTDQYNQLRTDYNAETAADHTDTTATAVSKLVVIE